MHYSRIMYMQPHGGTTTVYCKLCCRPENCPIFHTLSSGKPGLYALLAYTVGSWRHCEDTVRLDIAHISNPRYEVTTVVCKERSYNNVIFKRIKHFSQKRRMQLSLWKVIAMGLNARQVAVVKTMLFI